MEYRSLELTIHSADDLKNVDFFGKMNVYVVVSLLDWAEDPNYRTRRCPKQKTPIDKEGHRNPTWSFPIKFAISEIAIRHNRVSLLFQIRSRRVFPWDKVIGEVYVPLSNLLMSFNVDSKKPTIASYQVSKPSGKPKGVLNFSYRFPDISEEGLPIPIRPWTGEGKADYLDQVYPRTGYPAAPPHYGIAGILYGPPLAASGYPVPGYGYPVSPKEYGYPSQQEYACGYGCVNPLPPTQTTMQDKDNDNKIESEKVINSRMGRGMTVGLVASGALAGILIGTIVSNVASDDGFFEWWI